MFVLFVFRERENFSSCLVGREMYIFSEKRKGKKVGIKMSENYLHNCDNPGVVQCCALLGRGTEGGDCRRDSH